MRSVSKRSPRPELSPPRFEPVLRARERGAEAAIGRLEHVDDAGEAVLALSRRGCRPGPYGITSRPRTNRDQIPLIFHDSKRHVRASFRRELPTCGKTELQ